MAKVFLSYSREDIGKAEALASVLGEAGHQIWWDRHIQSGSEFGGAIEQALNDADVVLVLWSAASVNSPWVRDEAMEGRDTGRLVPVLLDGSRPPIGFRQFQTTDLSGWSGKGAPKQTKELLSAIERTDPQGEQAPAGPPVGTPAPRQTKRGPILAGALAVLLIAAALIGWLVLGRGTAAPEQPTIAVLPFEDLSPGGDQAYFSEGVAEEILSVLAREPGIKVIGRSSARQFQQASSNLDDIRQALGVTHVLEGSARTAGNQLRMSVRLIDAADGRQLWAENYQRDMSNVFAVQSEIGRAVARRLSGSLAGSGRKEVQATGADTYALYLAARAKMRERTLPALRQALEMARKVVAADPDYAPGHAIYAELLYLLSSANYGTMPVDRARELGLPHARRAIQLAPDQAEGYAALGMVSEGRESIEALSKAIKLDPSRGELRIWLADELSRSGDNERALKQFRSAVAMEPIWLVAVRNYVSMLNSSRLYSEADAAIDEFERRGGEPASVALLRAQSRWMRGDFSDAIRLSEQVAKLDPELLSTSPVHALLYFGVGLYERASELAANDRSLQLYATGRYTELSRLAEQEGFWNQSSRWIVSDALALARNWPALARFYAQRPASTICAQGHRVAINFAMALKAQGRAKEADELLDCIEKILARESRGEIRSFQYPADYLATLKAEVLAVRGKGEAAFREADRAVRLGAFSPYGYGASYSPAFDPYRGTKAYAELDARLKARAAKERAEVLDSSWGRNLR